MSFDLQVVRQLLLVRIDGVTNAVLQQKEYAGFITPGVYSSIVLEQQNQLESDVKRFGESTAIGCAHSVNCRFTRVDAAMQTKTVTLPCRISASSLTRFLYLFQVC
jgi:hypothetical protein